MKIYQQALLFVALIMARQSFAATEVQQVQKDNTVVTFESGMSAVNICMLKYIKAISGQDPSFTLDVSPEISVEELTQHCQQLVAKRPTVGALRQRLIQEELTERNPFILTSHLMNYILPVTYASHINTSPYESTDITPDDLKNSEVKFQLSIKVPLFGRNQFVKGDSFYFGFTMKSFWQLYSGHISAPFRETNYRPEIFYVLPLKHEPFGGNTDLILGFEHESNGQTQRLSRSWNRLYINFLYEQDDYALSFKPYYRIPERDKKHPDDAQGDDNPDIYQYMGYFEFGAAWKYEKYRFSVLARRNFAFGHGAIELGWTFPISGRIRGYVQYFNGYGESLIDYNHYQQRIGVGVALTDFL
jgi:phospholipase A1